MNWFALIIIAFIAVHQDVWNWRSVHPFVLGLPVGLWYHAMYTICAAGLMALLVHKCWPADPEDDEADGE